MAAHIKNEITEILWNGTAVNGILNGDESNWSFGSIDKNFLKLFGDGIVSNFTYLGSGSMYYEHHKFQLAVAERVKELIIERRTPAKPAYDMLRPVNGYRFAAR
jgi:hypothetical protein